MTRLFAQIRPTTWLVVGLTAIAYACAIVFVNAILFQGRLSQALGSLYEATGALVQGALIAGLFDLAVVAVVIFGIGRMRLSDIGWSASKVKWGLVATLGFWLAMQAAIAAFGSFELHDAWKIRGAGAIMGSLIGQLLGNALVEETVFRGFLIPQLYLKANRAWRSAASLTITTVAASVLFAVLHIPNRLWVREFSAIDLLWDQAGLFFFGVVFAVIYVVTRNLFIAVGLHALANEPAPVLRVPNETILNAIWFGLAAILLIGCWAVLRKAPHDT